MRSGFRIFSSFCNEGRELGTLLIARDPYNPAALDGVVWIYVDGKSMRIFGKKVHQSF